MPYVISNNGQSARWVDPEEGYSLKKGEKFSDSPEVVVVWSPEPGKAAVRAARIYPLNALTGIIVAEQAKTSPDAALIEAALAARQSLLDITKDATVLAATNDEEQKAAFVAAYITISTAAPNAIKSAFADMKL